MALDDIKVHVKFRLSALWSSLMFLYIYGDYFELYQPGKLQHMMHGRMALGAVSQGVLLVMAGMMVIPSLMVVLCLILPAAMNRGLNVLLGAAYTLIMVFAIIDSWYFYVALGVVEIAITLVIIWQAWAWPRMNALE